jgi:ethanolamine utilization protein EutQ (cupin superfamily)
MKPTYIETRGVTFDIAVFNDEPGGTTGVEDFRRGEEVEWSFYHDEVQYILKGKAEITYSLPPVHRRWYKTSAEEGCVYLIPRGARVKFKVIGDEPYRHLFVVMPGGFYPPDKFER